MSILWKTHLWFRVVDREIRHNAEKAVDGGSACTLGFEIILISEMENFLKKYEIHFSNIQMIAVG